MIPGSVKEEDVTTYQERPGSYLKKMSWKLLEEDVATYQERLGSYLKKLLRRIKSVLEVAWRSCSDASRVSWKLVEEDVATWYAMSLRRRRRASTWSHQWSPQFLHVGRPITRRKTHEILANLEAWPRGRVGIDWWASNVTPSGYWTDSYNWFLMAYLVRWCMIYILYDDLPILRYSKMVMKITATLNKGKWCYNVL